MEQSGGGTGPPTRFRRITACLRCRDRKKKCDRKLPECENCNKEGKDCVYASDHQQLREHKQRLHDLNRSFATKAAGAGKDLENPELNPLILADAAYEEDVDDDAADLGIKCGKLRISDRIGGFVRPKMVEELSNALAIADAKSPHVQEAVQDYMDSDQGPEPSPADFLKPGPTYFVPSSINWNSEISDEHLHMFPDHEKAELLLRQYWLSVHPIARLLHRPSFETKWNDFWRAGRRGQEVPTSLQALISAVLFSALASLPMGSSLETMDDGQKSWTVLMQKRTASALSRANWVRTAKVETLQALVIYLIPMCRAEVSRGHTILVAAAIRLAEALGLHVDGSTRGFPSIQTHIRRLLWYHLCILDLRTSEATGPRPVIREGEFDTQLPLELDDVDIEHLSEDSLNWTDMTVSIIRFKCNEFIRQILNARRLLQLRQITVTDVLVKIETFHKEMDKKYGKLAKDGRPIQKYGRLLYKLQILRTFGLVLHQYHLHPKVEMSDRLKSVFIVKGIETMETVIQIETDPDLAPWHWYSGALQQHHYALALLLEILINPQRREGPKVIRGLDYAFEPPTGLPPLERVRWTVRQIRDRMMTYVETRKIRAPISFTEQLRLDKDSPDGLEALSSSKHTTPEEGWQSATSSQVSDHQGEVSEQQTRDIRSANDLFARKQHRLDGDRKPNPTSQTNTSRMPDFSEKDIMDANWEAVADYFPEIQGNLNMSEEQLGSSLSTDTYTLQIPQYNVVPVSTIPGGEYTHYSPLTGRESSTASYAVASQYTTTGFLPYQATGTQYPSDAQYGTSAPPSYPNINSQSAASGFPEQSDNETNAGMGFYRAVNMERRL